MPGLSAVQYRPDDVRCQARHPEHFADPSWLKPEAARDSTVSVRAWARTMEVGIPEDVGTRFPKLLPYLGVSSATLVAT
jgi:hypothetical protein